MAVISLFLNQVKVLMTILTFLAIEKSACYFVHEFFMNNQ